MMIYILCESNISYSCECANLVKMNRGTYVPCGDYSILLVQKDSCVGGMNSFMFSSNQARRRQVGPSTVVSQLTKLYLNPNPLGPKPCTGPIGPT